jgi:hypothetical protein
MFSEQHSGKKRSAVSGKGNDEGQQNTKNTVVPSSEDAKPRKAKGYNGSRHQRGKHFPTGELYASFMV